jgi:hypothetical protein
MASAAQRHDRPSELGIGFLLFSHPPPVSTMASSQQPKGRDGVLPALDVLIQALNIAKDACGIPPAQIALSSASALLTMIRVPPPCSAKMIFRLTILGHDGQRSGLRRAGTGLRRCMPNALQKTEGEAIG